MLDMLIGRLIERERQERIGPLGAEFELGLPAVRTVASTHGAGALPTELNTAPSLCFSEFSPELANKVPFFPETVCFLGPLATQP